MLEFSVNRLIVNKPPVFEPRFADTWQAVSGDLQTLKDHVLQGFAWTPAKLSSNRRCSEAFTFAQLAVVDIDSGLTIEQFLQHPLAQQAAFAHTTASHDPAGGRERFRVVFRLPERISSAGLYTALVTLLIQTLGGDTSCKDPARLFYGCSTASLPLWQPEAVLDSSYIDQADELAAAKPQQNSSRDHDYDDTSIGQAIFCLEHVLIPTEDGQRERYVRITAAASSAGEALFPAWQNWAFRCHHSQGRRRKQASERWYNGFRGGSSLGTLFHLASEDDPDWRDRLPDELRSKGSGNWVNDPSGGRAGGYSHEEFCMPDPFEHPPIKAPQSKSRQETQSLFDPDADWRKLPPPPRPAQPQGPIATAPAPQHEPDKEEEDDISLDPWLFGRKEPSEEPPEDSESTERRRGRPRKPSPTDDETIEIVKARLLHLYPQLRLNTMTQKIEYGPRDQPSTEPDLATAYVRISRGSGTVFQKSLVHDTAQIIAYESRYHPVKAYLDHCRDNAQPSPLLTTIASELLGLPDDPAMNPRFIDGRLYADVIMERFLIGAVARILEPGCRHDWMPILTGPQNCGKSTFFRYLTPPLPGTTRDHAWTATIQQGITHLKEKPHALHAGWIVLLDETERYFQRRYLEEFKNLLTVQVDRSARKWENERDFPRSFVLAGCANSAEFLVDPTGNRRFMVVPVAGRISSGSTEEPDQKIIDLDRLSLERDSLWAAAYQAYINQQPHTFSSAELVQLEEYLKSFRRENPIETRLRTILQVQTTGIWNEFKYVNLSDVYHWLDLPLHIGGTVQRSVTDALKQLGWENKVIKIAGKQHRVWLKSLKADHDPDSIPPFSAGD